jgi:hypothetical protein
MGLINLKTNLKSLGYGNDQRGGGSSNQPYIVTPIPDGYAPTSPDFLLRNGYLNPVSSLNDVSRLTKWFTDTKSINGILFTAKQLLLERQNVQTPGGFNRIYNPAGTIAQAGGLSSGLHLNKQGLNPFITGYFNGGREGYFYPTRAGSTVNEGKNRLTILYTSKITDQPLTDFSINPFGITGPEDQVNLLSYSGGPNSILGIGKTNIRIQNPTRTVISKEKATIAFKSTLVDNVGYLTPTGSFSINWSYNPSISSSLGFSGASKKFLDISSDPSYIEEVYTDNVNKVLNRDNSTVIPIGKSANKFSKTQWPLKSEFNKYLVPSGIIPGNITYQTSLTGSSDVLPFKNAIKSLGGDGYKNQALTIISTGSLYNISNLKRVSYYKTKDLNVDVVFPNYLLFQTASIEAKKIVQGNILLLDSTQILNNLNQAPPDIFNISDDIVKGKEKTTLLSNLNSPYIKRTSPNIAQTNRISTFNAGSDYSVYDNSSLIKLGPNTLAGRTDLQNNTSIQQGSRNDQNEKADYDLIKFFFEINNNDSDTNTQNWFLFFRAYLNDLSDNFKAEWQSYKYVGRAENFYKYGGFSRDMSLSFTIYAHSRAEMIPIYDKLNYLVGVTAPSYSGAGYMRGNFVNLTIGDYLDNVPGIINSVDLKPNFETGWDINRDENGIIIPSTDESYVGQLPRSIEVNLSFTPIHSFTPQFGQGFIRNASPPPLPTTTPINQPSKKPTYTLPPPSLRKDTTPDLLRRPIEVTTPAFPFLPTL